MVDFFLFALLPVSEHGFSGIVCQQYGTAFFKAEILDGDLLSIEKCEHGAIGKDGTKFFHQIEGERGTPGSVAMEKSALRIEAHGFAGRAAVVHEDDVKKREQSIHGIEGWAAGASFDLQLWIAGGDELGKGLEIECGAVALNAANAIERGGAVEVGDALENGIAGAEEYGAAVGVLIAVVAGGAHEDLAAVMKFRGDHIGGNGAGGGFGIGAAVLFTAEEDVS